MRLLFPLFGFRARTLSRSDFPGDSDEIGLEE